MGFSKSQKTNVKILVVFAVLFVSGLISFTINRFFPFGQSISLGLMVNDTIGGTVLRENEVEDIRIYYATERYPVYTEEHKITKNELLASEGPLFNQEHVVSLPGNTIRIRVDLAPADTVSIPDEVFPVFGVRINGNEIGDRIHVAQTSPDGKESCGVFWFEIGENDIVKFRQLYSFRRLIPLFLISLIICCVFIRLAKKYPRSVLILSFFLIILFPNFKFKTDKATEQENRNLAPFPTEFHIRDVTAFTSQIEKFYNDRFFGRGFLIRISDEVKSCFDDRGSDRVLRGDDDWLFYQESFPETKFSWDFSKEQMVKAGQYLNDLAQYAASRGKTFIYVICPDKIRIYGDKSKYYSPKALLEENIVDRFVEYLRARYDFPVIYQRQGLLQKREETAHDLYYKYDTHWTTEGAYYGLVLPLLNTLSVTPPSVDRWKPVLEMNGDLSAMLIHDRSCKESLIPQKIYEPIYGKTAIVHEKEDEHSPQRTIIESTNPDGAPKNILFLRDSFSTAAVGMISNSFQHSVFLWRYRLFQTDMDYIDQSDIIVLEQVERFVYLLGGLVFDKEELQ